jgi:hypothetical protein
MCISSTRPCFCSLRLVSCGACRAPGKAREVKIVGVKRNLVSFVMLAIGIILLYRTKALLTLAIAVILGVLCGRLS